MTKVTSIHAKIIMNLEDKKMRIEEIIEYLDNSLADHNKWKGHEDCHELIKAFLNGEWIESETIQNILNLSFAECFSLFDSSIKSEWWSIVGKTDEERQRNGQKITSFFKIKEVPCTWDERQKKGCIGWCGLPFC